MESFGMRLARLRKQKNLTQQDIADSLNISYQAVSKWENDITAPDIDAIVKLADIFDVSADELLGRENRGTVYLAAPTEDEIKTAVLKVKVLSAAGDKVTVKLPVAVIRMMIESGLDPHAIAGNSALEELDFNRIIAMIDMGIFGELISVESAVGDTVSVFVEKQ